MTHDESAAEEQLGREPGALPGEPQDSDTPAGQAAAPNGASPPAPPANRAQAEVPGSAAERSDGAADVEGDLDQLVRTAAQRDEYLALAQRTQADFENYRKRVARDAAAAQERGAGALAKELLPALDNLDRALEEAGKGSIQDAPEDPLLHGVRLVRSELAGALARAGIESYSPAGEPFDPELHEAVATAAVEGAESGTVVEVYQAGYRHRSGIIRPARVVVAA